MLESIELINFQCHKELKLEFDPGVNVIAGTSDSGKSAILKGLLWLITNRPQGLGFRNMQAKKNDLVSVKVTLDGHEISRSRSESVNEYLFDGQKYVAMKNDVPKEIAQFLNLLPVNIQTQFQPHYLLSASPGEVAKVLNESCDLSVIDMTMKRIKAIEQSSRSDAKSLDMQEKDIQDELANLDWVEDASESVKLIKSQMQIVERKRDEIDELSLILGGLEKIESQLGIVAERNILWASFDSIKDEVDCWQKDVELTDVLTSIVSKMQVIDVEMGKKHLDITAPLVVLQKDVDVLQDEKASIAELDELLVRLGGIDSGIAIEQGRKEAVAVELMELWKSVDVCPLCGANVKR